MKKLVVLMLAGFIMISMGAIAFADPPSFGYYADSLGKKGTVGSAYPTGLFSQSRPLSADNRGLDFSTTSIPQFTKFGAGLKYDPYDRDDD